MSGVARVARFRIEPQRREAPFTACADYAETARAEAGVHVWGMRTNPKGEHDVWLFVRANEGASLQRTGPQMATFGVGRCSGPPSSVIRSSTTW